MSVAKVRHGGSGIVRDNFEQSILLIRGSEMMKTAKLALVVSTFLMSSLAVGGVTVHKYHVAKAASAPTLMCVDLGETQENSHTEDMSCPAVAAQYNL